MKNKFFVTAATILLLQLTPGWGRACGDYVQSPRKQIRADLARTAVSTNEVEATLAIDELRRLGPAGLEALLTVHSNWVEPLRAGMGSFAKASDAVCDRLEKAADAIAQQRDAVMCGLYWHTDLEAAKLAARAQGKPILSLRLLGRLNEEFSCANSRFFRTVLYANTEVSEQLREHFILHWQSVRPIPRITIDFGDGRRLEKTITGNSIHYVLDTEGRPVDALPGLYGPKMFLRHLERAGALALTCSAETANRSELMHAYHTAALNNLSRQWQEDLTRADSAFATSIADRSLHESVAALPPEMWTKVATLYAAENRLDNSSRALMRYKQFGAVAAARLAVAKARTEDPLLRVLFPFERALAEDTVRNEYLFHSRIHEWLVQSEKVTGLDQLNERVYAELFLTPSSDPWLGLKGESEYVALDQSGVSTATGLK